MNKQTLFVVFIFVFLFAGPVLYADEFQNPIKKDFPTNQGNFFISGAVEYSRYHNHSTDSPRAAFKASLGIIMFTDIGIAMRLSYNKSLSEERRFTDFEIGPQLLWFIGGTMHREKIKGSIYHYLGLTAFGRFREDYHSLTVPDRPYVKSDISYVPYNNDGFGYGLTFGFGAGISNSSMLFFEANASIADDHSGPGTDLIIEGMELNTDLGLVLYHFIM